MGHGELDPRGIDQVLRRFSVGPTQTAFAGVRSLAPGTIHLVEDGAASTRRYWQVDFPDAGYERRDKALVDELEAALDLAVTRRLRADGPIAVYLSGGIDSSVVLSMAAHRGKDVRAFAIAQDGTGPDEAGAARSVAEQLGVPLTLCPMNAGEIVQGYIDATQCAEVPVVDTSTACLLQLARLVRREGHNVALCGEGAGEALAGYAWFAIDAAIGRTGMFPRWGRAASRAVFSAVGNVSHERSITTAQHFFREPLARAAVSVRGPRLNRLSDDPDEHPSWHARARSWAPLNHSLAVEYHHMLPCHLLATKGDRVTLGASVEGRYPFLDEDLVALCASVAPTLKLRRFTSKWLLRQVVRRRLGEKISRRPKRMLRSVRTPILLGKHRPSWVDELLSEESLRRTSLFDVKMVRREWWLQRHSPIPTPRRLVMDATLTAVLGTQLLAHLFTGARLCHLPTASFSAA